MGTVAKGCCKATLSVQIPLVPVEAVEGIPWAVSALAVVGSLPGLSEAADGVSNWATAAVSLAEK